MSRPEVVTIEIRPTVTPARELPFGLLYDLREVMAAYGLQVEAAEWPVFLIGMVHLVDAVPIERGGRKE